MNIMDVLESLEELIDRGVNMPFTGGKSLCDTKRLSVIIDELKRNIPQELDQAKAILHEREQLLGNARQEAEETVKRANDRARALVAQQEILKQAQERAKEVTHKAETESAELRSAAQKYVESQMMAVEDLLSRQLKDVREVHTVLKRKSKQK